MWSCKCDMAVMSCSSSAVSKLVNPPPQPLFCLVTLLLASSLNLISLIIVPMKWWMWKNVTLILFLCHIQACFSVPRRLCYSVWFMRRTHIALPLFVSICRQFLTASRGFVAYMSLPCPPFLQYAIYESAGKGPGPRLWFNVHTPMDQGLGECMCWWKSNVLCPQGTACFSLSLPRLQNLVSHTNLGFFS